MKSNQTVYYFSTLKLFFASVVLAAFSSIWVYFILIFYKESLIYATLFSLPLVVLLIGLPDYTRIMYCTITNKPALILSEVSLINNATGKEYSWSQIKLVSYELHSGIKAPPGGFISLALRDSKDTFTVPHKLIKCKTKTLLRDLQKYHKAHYRREHERNNK